MCCSKNFIKRVFPFFLTFAVGLFVASFFITIAAPSFPLRGGRYRHQQQDRLMQLEIERLRDENLRLKSESVDRIELSDADSSDAVPAPPMPPMPPPAPTRNFRR